MQNEIRILVTGFEPFMREDANPSGDFARALNGRRVNEAAIVGRVLPVVWDEAPRLIQEWIEELHPHIVIALGQGDKCINIEKNATKVRGSMEDNNGALPVPVHEKAIFSFPTTLPEEELVRAFSDEDDGKPWNVVASEYAGRYLCEAVFYALMSAQDQNLAKKENSSPLLRAGFIHLPTYHLMNPDEEEFRDEKKYFDKGKDEARKQVKKRIRHIIEIIVEKTKEDLQNRR